MLLPDQRYEPAAAVAALLCYTRTASARTSACTARAGTHITPGARQGLRWLRGLRGLAVAGSGKSFLPRYAGSGERAGRAQYARDRAREWSLLSAWSGAAAVCDASGPAAMATLGLSKVFILDKYFTELQKFWETEKKLQGERRAVGSRCGLCG
ncbi:hypothetical protein RR46_03476 [Papilio xuthus]|uniref:Uncharacterized protein n=1 Tax=Papilio xuthus TaxID=66420 RepID=A0A194QFF5_PAPXU|nr:hypothetical protein RR46_03476 [Papilio xuthus]